MEIWWSCVSSQIALSKATFPFKKLVSDWHASTCEW
jgi:hypothetical protein